MKNEIEAFRRVYLLGRSLYLDGLELCLDQRSLGDFYLKTLVARLASAMIVSGVETKLKADRLLFTEAEPLPVAQLSVVIKPARNVLESIIGRLQRILEVIEETVFYCERRQDWFLARTLFHLRSTLEATATSISQWLEIGPSERADLHAHLGLLRDCEISREAIGGRSKPFWIGRVSLEPTILRAWYLSGNAYLELTTVDIISDLILRAAGAGLVELVRDLCFQLADEVRHAELLSGHLEPLGFSLGCVPASVATWELYEACDTIVEKIAAQHVVQESVGLDISALNVGRMRKAGDEACAQTFVRIAADERSHLELGTRWLKRLAGEESETIFRRVMELSNRFAPVPDVPVIPELRVMAGYPGEWLAEEVVRKGAVTLADLVKDFGPELATAN